MLRLSQDVPILPRVTIGSRASEPLRWRKRLFLTVSWEWTRTLEVVYGSDMTSVAYLLTVFGWLMNFRESYRDPDEQFVIGTDTLGSVLGIKTCILLYITRGRTRRLCRFASCFGVGLHEAGKYIVNIYRLRL